MVEIKEIAQVAACVSIANLILYGVQKAAEKSSIVRRGIEYTGVGVGVGVIYSSVKSMFTSHNIVEAAMSKDALIVTGAAVGSAVLYDIGSAVHKAYKSINQAYENLELKRNLLLEDIASQ